MARKNSDVPTAAWVGLAALTAGVIFVATRRPAAASAPGASAATYEQAMMSHTTEEGALFLVWLVMYRAGLVDRPLVVGDSAGNNALIESGIRAAGPSPSSGPDAATVALCTAYKLKSNAGQLRAMPSGSPAFQAYMAEVISQYRATCLASGVRMD